MKLLITVLMATLSLNAHAGKKILVVLSSKDQISLKDAKPHPTGFFLSEMMVPLQAMRAAGYEPVFVTPEGGKLPAMDKVSDTAMPWFGQAKEADAKYKKYKGAYDELAAMKETGNLGNPKTLKEVAEGDLNQFAGLYVPGGHAPMEDLYKDPNLGKLLHHMHDQRKPTGAICHGPIALLSSMKDPDKFTKDLENGKNPKPDDDWIYKDCPMASFTTSEEQQEEPGQDNVLGGHVRFYPDQALRNAGAKIPPTAKWSSIVKDCDELITGQNPFSDEELGKKMVAALKNKEKENKQKLRQTGKDEKSIR